MIITSYKVTNTSYSYTNTTIVKRKHPYPPLKGSLKYKLREKDVKLVINSRNKMTIALCWIRFKKSMGSRVRVL